MRLNSDRSTRPGGYVRNGAFYPWPNVLTINDQQAQGASNFSHVGALSVTP